ncbi:MAG: SH3 domain-containing protein [Hungatella hathewayi]|nr:SH3 domain-containing protein [Hungatella hathewayi]
MRKMRYKHGLAMFMAMLLVINACLFYVKPSMESFAYTARSATINASNLNVRSGPGTTYSAITKLSQGTAVTVVGEKTASNGALWYEIRFSGTNGAETTGYVLNTYVKFPVSYQTSADFEAYLTAQKFPDSYKDGLRQLHAQYPNWVFTAHHTNLDWNTAVDNESVVGRNLVATGSVSSWKSIADGAYDWDASKWPGFDGSNWVAASRDIVAYYMDPRNFLDDTYIFQFLLQSYDSSAHTAAGLETMVKGTFLESTASGGGSPSGGSSPGGTSSGGSSSVGPGGVSSGTDKNNSGSSGGASGGPGTSINSNEVKLEAPGASISSKDRDRLMVALGPGMTGGPGSVGSGSSPSTDGSGSAPLSGSSSYVDIIMNAGAQSGVNPYVLAAMILQEQGKGTSGLISGTYSGYEGYYNFFNVEAYQSGSMSAIERGLWYASQSGTYGRPWNSVEKSILGGAQIYGETYVKAGQNTFYLKKYNVQGSNLYKHQYMTNVQGAASEGAIYAKAYSSELKNTALEFRIPVYNNMPAAACAKPTQDGSPNNKLAGLGVNGFALTPTFNKDTTSYNLIVDTSVSQVTINAAVIDSTASVSGAGTVNLQGGGNDITIAVTAQNGSVRNYVIHVVRQQNGPTNDGSVNSGITGNSPGTSPGTSSPGGNTGSSGTGSPGGSPGNSGGSGTSSPAAGSTGGPGASSGSGSSTTNSGPGGSDIVIIP